MVEHPCDQEVETKKNGDYIFRVRGLPFPSVPSCDWHQVPTEKVSQRLEEIGVVQGHRDHSYRLDLHPVDQLGLK